MLESRQLIHFLEIAKKGSFRSAAKELNLSQPAVSRSVQGLEALLGVKLFDRGRGKVKLTVFGEAILPRATTILNSIDDIRQLIEEMKGLKIGEFRVGFEPVYADLLAASSLSHFAKTYPGVRIQTRLGTFSELIAA
jgi:DNA-binding transcriptional LysR family regulator